MGLARYERRILKQKFRNREHKSEKVKKANYAIIGLIVLLVSFLGYTFTGFSVKENNLDGFAQCLSEKNVKFFGAYWCTNCDKQKQLFGSSIKYVNYIECDLNGQESPSCIDKNIKGYPTWEIGGEQYLGIQTLEKLSELSGCKL